MNTLPIELVAHIFELSNMPPWFLKLVCKEWCNLVSKSKCKAEYWDVRIHNILSGECTLECLLMLRQLNPSDNNVLCRLIKLGYYTNIKDISLAYKFDIPELIPCGAHVYLQHNIPRISNYALNTPVRTFTCSTIFVERLLGQNTIAVHELINIFDVNRIDLINTNLIIRVITREHNIRRYHEVNILDILVYKELYTNGCKNGVLWFNTLNIKYTGLNKSHNFPFILTYEFVQIMNDYDIQNYTQLDQYELEPKALNYIRDKGYDVFTHCNTHISAWISIPGTNSNFAIRKRKIINMLDQVIYRPYTDIFKYLKESGMSLDIKLYILHIDDINVISEYLIYFDISNLSQDIINKCKFTAYNIDKYKPTSYKKL